MNDQIGFAKFLLFKMFHGYVDHQLKFMVNQTKIARLLTIVYVVYYRWVMTNKEECIYKSIFLFFNGDTYMEQESNQSLHT